MVSTILLDDIKASSDKYSAEYKKNQQLSQYQFQGLIGLILGDVHIIRRKPTSNTSICF